MPSESDRDRVYREVSEKIAARVAGYMPGDRLPTIAALAVEHVTSETTVKNALVLLGRDGWTIGRQGKGTFVADRPPPTS